MHRFLNLVTRFGHDERGVFAIVFALMALVLVAFGGATVDYVSLQQARNRAQVALDAAALALQPEIFNATITKDQIRLKAQALMVDRIGSQWGVVASIPESGVTIDTTNGSLYLKASLAMPTMFVRLVGVNELKTEIQSEAQRKKLALEVALVLDNSGSMTKTDGGTRTRMAFLTDAAKCAVNIIFFKDVVDQADTCVPVAGATKLPNVEMAIVPFTMFVNVGSGNQNASWIDKGQSSISNDNFDDGRAVPGSINRFTLFSATKEAWAGCVEARPHTPSGTAIATEYLDTDDTPPVAGDTLFVPLFAPDIEDSVANGNSNSYLNDLPANNSCYRPSPSQCVQTQARINCKSDLSGTCAIQTAGTPVPNLTSAKDFTSSLYYPNAYYGAHSPTCSCNAWTAYSAWTYSTGSGSNQTFIRTRTCVGDGYVPTGLTQRQEQERICKYYGVATTASNATRGPNADCGDAPILALTNTPKTVTDSITAMKAEGGTNIHEGTAWGFRVLSPGAPFTEGASYDPATNMVDSNTAKIMIVMTDGENTAYNLSTPNYCNTTTMRAFNGSCFNSAYGYPYNSRNNTSTSSSGGMIERLGNWTGANGSLGVPNADLVTAMNTRLTETCTNAKAKGIVVYTIGLATNLAEQSTQKVVEDTLTACASSPDKARFPKNPSELKSVFQAIANELTSLRLAQ